MPWRYESELTYMLTTDMRCCRLFRLREREGDVLPDGDGQDEGVPLQPDDGRSVPERQQLRVLRRRPPVGGCQRLHGGVHDRGGHRAGYLGIMVSIK